MRTSIRSSLLVALFVVSSLPSVESFRPTTTRTPWALSVPPMTAESSRVSGHCSTSGPFTGSYSRRSTSSTRTTSTRLHLGIDDLSWADISSTTGNAAAMKSVQLSQVVESLSHSQWYNTFSQEWFAAVFSAISNLWQVYAQLPLASQAALVLAPFFTAAMTMLYSMSFPPPDYRSNMEPYKRGNYDPIQAKAYYSKHPYLVLLRLLELFRLSNHFLTNQLLDRYVFRCEEEMRPKRAQELLQLITQLGPTAVKVGQALSVRSDIIPQEYASALATLQDQVPPFDGPKAKDILLRELGAERFGNLKGIGLDGRKRGPVASASIGQVYRGFVNDVEVAVKVQRPNVLAEIALDLYIVRELAPLYQAITRTNTDLQSLANEWGRGFIVELDYRKEAAATIKFNEEMAKRRLNAVCAPTVIPEYSTEQILVTEWVDGTRLDQASEKNDIPRLCSVALNAYLVMLLELQSLHCDPHPGNLLRTKDGRLCILDFGMTLDVDPNLQYSLLEFVAHLTSDNYNEIADDMVNLGFLKPDKLEFCKRSGVLEPLKYFLKKVGQGGGADSIRERIYDEYREKYEGKTDDELREIMKTEMKQQMVNVVKRESVATGITVEVEELQRQNRDSFRIPEWFLYTSRAFLTLEGVSLQADPNYSIIKSCFPYVAKRLVGDDDPRAVKALKDLLYGATDALDVDRLSKLADGFSSYTTSTKTINQQATAKPGQVVLTSGDVERVSKEEARKKKMVEAEAAITLAKDSADILLAPQGNLMQSLLVEEGALVASARFKDAVKKTLVDGPKKFRKALPLGLGTFLPHLPFEDQVEPFVRKSAQEIKAQELAEKLAKLAPSPAVLDDDVSPVASGSAAVSAIVKNLRSLDPEQAALVLKELRENLPKYGPMMGQLGGKFMSSLLKTASFNIETTLNELEKAGEQPDNVMRVTAKRLSSAAQRGATVFNTADMNKSDK